MSGGQQRTLQLEIRREGSAVDGQVGALDGVQSYLLSVDGGAEELLRLDPSRPPSELGDAIRQRVARRIPANGRVYVRSDARELQAVSWVDALFPGDEAGVAWMDGPATLQSPPEESIETRFPSDTLVDVPRLDGKLKQLAERWHGVSGSGVSVGTTRSGASQEVWLTPGGRRPEDAGSVCIRLHLDRAPASPSFDTAAFVADVVLGAEVLPEDWIESLWIAMYNDFLPLSMALVHAHRWHRGKGSGSALRMSVPPEWRSWRPVRVPPWPGQRSWHMGWKKVYPGRWETDPVVQQAPQTWGGTLVVTGLPRSGRSSFVYASVLPTLMDRGAEGYVEVRSVDGFEKVRDRQETHGGFFLAVIDDAAASGDPRLADWATTRAQLGEEILPIVVCTEVPTELTDTPDLRVAALTSPDRDALLTVLRRPAEAMGYAFEPGMLEGVVDQVLAERPPEEVLEESVIRMRARWAAMPGMVFRLHDGVPVGGVASLDTDRPLKPGVDARAQDHLEFATHIEAFTDLVLSTQTNLPLSVGLFGEWGSGKSFFMQSLAQSITARARKVRSEQRDSKDWTDWHGRVAPIHFNAWHFADTDLWASLVHHLFKELGSWLSQESAGALDRDNAEVVDEEGREAMFMQMFQHLRTTKKRLAKAEVERTAAQKQLDSAEHERRTALKKGWIVAQHALDVMLGDLADAWEQTPPSRRIDPPANAEAAASPKATPPITAAERADINGLLGMVSEAEAVRTALGDGAPATMAETQSFVRSWGQDAWRRTFFEWLISGPQMGARVLFLVLILAIPYLFHLVADWLSLWGTVCTASDGPPAACKSGVTAVVFVLNVLAQMGLAFKVFRGWIGRVAPGLVAGLRDPAVLKRRLRRFEQLKQRLGAINSDARAEVTRLDAAVGAARQQVAQAEAAIRRARSGWALDELVQQASGDRYREHLGLMATINEDLEHLGEILTDLERTRATAARAAEKNADAAAFVPTPAPRIVLFIDDLDRCPPKRVVEVLEAVHLLLAKELFMVVVAVDPRWLLRSIDTHFIDLIAEQPDEAKPGAVGMASSRQYLEKIFQVPFQVPPMTSAGYSRLVSDLVGEPLDGLSAAGLLTEDLPTDHEASDAEPSVAGGGLDDAPAAEAPVMLAEGVDDDAMEDTDVLERADSAERVGAGGVGGEAEVEEAAPAEADRGLPPAARVRFTALEHRVLRDLAPLIRTPRAAKRLVNTARLVRLQASRSGDWERLRVPTLLLLGLEVGCFELWSALRARLAEGGHADAWWLLEELARDGEHAGEALGDVLKRLAAVRPPSGSEAIWKQAMRLSERFAFVLDGGHTRVDG